jgi:hypothetical protein
MVRYVAPSKIHTCGTRRCGSAAEQVNSILHGAPSPRIGEFFVYGKLSLIGPVLGEQD